MWIQQVGMFEVEIDLLEVEIDKKLAVRKKIKDNKNISIDDIYVVPGTQNLSARSITYYLDPHSLYRNKHRVYIQTTVALKLAELKADRTYIVKANLHPDITGVLSIEVVDKKIGKVVSRNLNTHFKYKAVSAE